MGSFILKHLLGTSVLTALICYQVQYGDQVKLESMKTEGQFLHCSGRTFDLDDIHPYL